MMDISALPTSGEGTCGRWVGKGVISYPCRLPVGHTSTGEPCLAPEIQSSIWDHERWEKTQGSRPGPEPDPEQRPDPVPEPKNEHRAMVTLVQASLTASMQDKRSVQDAATEIVNNYDSWRDQVRRRG